MSMAKCYYIKKHYHRDDLACNSLSRQKVGGETYKLIHYTNSDTCFVSRVINWNKQLELKGRKWFFYKLFKDRILVPVNVMVRIPLPLKFIRAVLTQYYIVIGIIYRVKRYWRRWRKTRTAI